MAKDTKGKGKGKGKKRSKSEDSSRRRRSPSKGASRRRCPEDYEMRSRSVDSSRRPRRGGGSRGEKDRYRDKPRRNQTEPSWSEPEKKGYDDGQSQGYDHRVGGDLPPPYDRPVGPGPAGPGGYSHNVTVVTVPAQPQYQGLANPPPDYIIFNVAMTIFCCFWLGIAGIVCGKESQSASRFGEEEKAKSRSKSAKGFGIAALVVGLVEVGISVGILVWLKIGVTTLSGAALEASSSGRYYG